MMMDGILFIDRPEVIELFSDKFVDFYLEDDMFELEGKFFLSEDGDLMIEVLDAVGHILEMSGKYLMCGQRGIRPTATRPDDHTFDMEVNRVYYIMNEPTPQDFKDMVEKHDITLFFQKIIDVMVEYHKDTGKWSIIRDKINMLFYGNRIEYDTIEELLEENNDLMENAKNEWKESNMSGNVGIGWEAVCYKAKEEEDDFTSFVGAPTPEFDKW